MPMTFMGTVTKAGFMQKTVTVTISRFATDKKTGKRLTKLKKILTHDPQDELKKDDVVVIRHCRPLSARKRFTLHQLVRSPATVAAQALEEYQKSLAAPTEGASLAAAGQKQAGSR